MWRCVTKELFVSPCMQHVMCGIPMIELHQDRAIYKVGAPRKACYRISEAFHDTMIFLGNTTKVHSINIATKNYYRQSNYYQGRIQDFRKGGGLLINSD